MSFIRATIPISQLNLDQGNPRYDAVATQEAALVQMVMSDPDGTYNLANDIVERGLSPSELPIIYQNETEQYIVKDGNRRISAINAVLHPRRLPRAESNLIRKFEALRLAAVRKDPELRDLRKIFCCVFTDEDEADHWIYLRHTGENDGVGTVKWDSLQKKRFVAHQTGDVPYDLVAYNLAEANADEDLRRLMGQKFSITNLERLLDDPVFRKDMGFTVEVGELKFTKPENEAIRNLLQVVKDIATKRKKVPDFFDNDKRAVYADELRDLGFLQNVDELPTPLLVPTVEQLETEDVPAPELPPRRIRPRRPSSERVQLIPAEFMISISNDRANEIYHELKNINTNRFPNAVSMELRVFLEFSVNQYLVGKMVQGISPSSDLVTKIKRIADHFDHEGTMTSRELTGIRALCNEDGSRPITLVTELNQYVHNADFNPIASSLKVSWMNLQKFIEKLWDTPAG